MTLVGTDLLVNAVLIDVMFANFKMSFEGCKIDALNIYDLYIIRLNSALNDITIIVDDE